ncbi:amino acid ABC transporter permease [Vagococcus luciliae]|uniref:L-cystine transport system permease protein YecS n=1 Tax=Vagococcus luciliae TaxID=2920380 RepID=A0ABY5P129_9ENTE|nr:amino acid ABC transporter permease [Vagococcus luciliae]UUV99629.1 L-cystine transport system permease protein YecS [Vagococcus luciliae]
MIIDTKLLVESIPFVLKGLPYTLLISIASFFLGNILASLIYLLRLLNHKVINQFLIIYSSFFRGIPAIVLLFALYFGLPMQLNPIVASILCFGLTSSAFLSEIFRSAMSSVNQGQWEASKALGMPKLLIIREIIMPQAIRIAIGPMSNVAIDLVKGSSLAAMITVSEIFQQAKIIGGREFNFLSMYFLVACIYWGLCIIIEKIQYALEKRFPILS